MVGIVRDSSLTVLQLTKILDFYIESGFLGGYNARPLLYRVVAQLAEQRSPKPQVGGSSPSYPATFLKVV